MKDSILLSVKKLLPIADDTNEFFDESIIMYINSEFSKLTMLGVGPASGFSIKDESAEWSSFLPTNDPRFEMVKTYMGASVRKKFDPPTSSIVLQSLEETIGEQEFYLSIAASTPLTTSETTEEEQDE